MLHKLTPVWERLFYAMAAVSFFYLTAVALYWNRTDPLAITVAAVCGLALLTGLWRLTRSDGFAALAEDPRRRRLLFTVISGVFLVLCLASALIQLEDFTGTDWDIWVIHAEAQNIARHPFPAEMQNAAYFYRFPNNAALLALFTGWYRLWLAIGGAGVDLNLASALLAAGSLWAAQLLFYHAVRLFAGPAQGLFCAAVWVLVLPFYGYAATPYSDTMSLPFCTGMLLCLALLWRSKNPLWALGVGACAGAAFQLKGTYAVLAVAVAIWLALLNFGRLRRKLTALLVFAVCFFGFSAGFRAFYTQSGIWGTFSAEYVKQEWQVPTTHWLMMAQNPDGPWVAEDYDFTYGLQQGKFSYDARTRICLQMCFDRIASRDLKANLLFTNRKVVETWKDGTFQVNQYDRDTYYHPDAPIRQFFNPGTRPYQVFACLSNALYFAFLLCLVAGAIRRLLQKDSLTVDGVFFAHLCLFGMFLLELVWEWRSRYLFGYLPFLILAAPSGIQALAYLLFRLFHPVVRHRGEA